MASHNVKLLPANVSIEVPTGTLVSEAIQKANLEIAQPCGGQGRCGRCAVIIKGEGARARSTIRLSHSDIKAGYVLACQTVVEGNITVTIPEQEKIQRRLVTDKAASKIEIPFEYQPETHQSIRAIYLELPPPTLEDNIDDLTRLEKALSQIGFQPLDVPLPILRKLGLVLREADWSPWVVLETQAPSSGLARMIDVRKDAPEIYGLAIDIGTTTVTAHLVNLRDGEIKPQPPSTMTKLREGRTLSHASSMQARIMAYRSWGISSARLSTPCSPACTNVQESPRRTSTKSPWLATPP